MTPVILSDATVVVPFPEIGRSEVGIQMAKCRGQQAQRLVEQPAVQVGRGRQQSQHG